MNFPPEINELITQYSETTFRMKPITRVDLISVVGWCVGDKPLDKSLGSYQFQPGLWIITQTAPVFNFGQTLYTINLASVTEAKIVTKPIVYQDLRNYGTLKLVDDKTNTEIVSVICDPNYAYQYRTLRSIDISPNNIEINITLVEEYREEVVTRAIKTYLEKTITNEVKAIFPQMENRHLYDGGLCLPPAIMRQYFPLLPTDQKNNQEYWNIYLNSNNEPAIYDGDDEHVIPYATLPEDFKHYFKLEEKFEKVFRSWYIPDAAVMRLYTRIMTELYDRNIHIGRYDLTIEDLEHYTINTKQACS